MTMAPTPAAATKPANNNENMKKNRIQVSNTKKPLFFYVNLAKRYLQQHNEIELSALGMAITTVVTISEILKNNGFVKEKSIVTSTVGMKDPNKGRLVHKARIEILLEKSEKFESLMNASHAAQQTAANAKANNAGNAKVTTATTNVPNAKVTTTTTATNVPNGKVENK